MGPAVVGGHRAVGGGRGRAQRLHGGADPGRFPPGVERGFNTFAFFTVQSNLIVGATTGLLALRLDRPSTVFRTFRLIGLVAITVTGVVYHVALASISTLAASTSWCTPWCRSSPGC